MEPKRRRAARWASFALYYTGLLSLLLEWSLDRAHIWYGDECVPWTRLLRLAWKHLPDAARGVGPAGLLALGLASVALASPPRSRVSLVAIAIVTSLPTAFMVLRLLGAFPCPSGEDISEGLFGWVAVGLFALSVLLAAADARRQSLQSR